MFIFIFLNEISFSYFDINPLRLSAMNNNQEILNFFMSQKEIIISKDLFNRCWSLTKIKIPKYIKKIGYRAFENCTSLTEVVFEEPSSLLFICSCAFKGCKSLVQISIPSKVLLIGNDAFFNCTSLEQISIPSNTRIIDRLSNTTLNVTTVQSQPIQDEYEKALHRFVSVIDLTEFRSQNSSNDQILNHIVDAFKKFPFLFNEDAKTIMAKLSELGLASDIEKYFSSFYFSEVTIFIRGPNNYFLVNKTYNNLTPVNELYEEMYKRYYDGVNSIFMLYKSKILPRTGTFKDHNIRNGDIINFCKTLIGG